MVALETGSPLAVRTAPVTTAAGPLAVVVIFLVSLSISLPALSVSPEMVLFLSKKGPIPSRSSRNAIRLPGCRFTWLTSLASTR